MRLIQCLLLVVTLVTPAEAELAKRNWPRWRTPEAAGFSSERLAEAQSQWEAIDDAPLAALFLAYKGRVLMSIGDVTADFECHSVRKSFMSALYGIHVDKGTIDLEATLDELGIDDDTPLTRVEKQARVIDLLMARSGIYIEAACESQGMKDTRPARGSHEPGSYWYYNNWDFNALGTIFRQETGRDIFREFRKKIAQPIGMQDFRPSRCTYYFESEYSRHPCYVFRMSARDRARFGQLFLQRGRWGKKQIIPEAWVDESTRAHSRTERLTGTPGAYYGYMWWIFKKEFFRSSTSDRRLHHLSAFFASGYGGQQILVIPDAEMVFVTTCNVPAGCFLEGEETGPILEIILTAREIVDLKVRQAQVREKVVSTGETLHMVAKVKNLSAARTLATTVVFYLSPVRRVGEDLRRLGSAPLAALASGKGKTVRLAAPVPAGLASGRYRLIAAVDADKTNYDLRRNNNLKTARPVLEIR